MRRGTTPTHTFSTDVDLTSASVIWLTYKQGGKVLLTKEKDDMTVTTESIEVTLTQNETLTFSDNKGVEMQIRAKFPNGSAIASNVMNASVDKILKDGVIA